MKIKYQEIKFKPPTLEIIKHASRIIAEYTAQGHVLTMRQLYYQFVARDLIENKQSEYKRLGGIIGDARLAGLISWKAIEDRTRNLQQNSHWESPSEIIEICAKTFKIDKWYNQENRVEVWIEKDALVGVIENACRRNDCAFFSCRGYASLSEMWVAGQRLSNYIQDGQKPIIIHLGDHDPSGVDMSRDIKDRLEMFCGEEIQVDRIALNMDQIKKYNPPPAPAKDSDSRSKTYIPEHGKHAWELDALTPGVLDQLIEDTIFYYREEEKWEAAIEEEKAHRVTLQKVAKGLNKGG